MCPLNVLGLTVGARGPTDRNHRGAVWKGVGNSRRRRGVRLWHGAAPLVCLAPYLVMCEEMRIRGGARHGASAGSKRGAFRQI